MRLAYETGVLRQPDLSPVQRWALMYYLNWDTERQERQRSEVLKTETFIHNPKRYIELFAKPMEEIIAEQESAPIAPEELDDIDAWLATVDKKRVGRPLDDDEGWI